MPRSGSASRRRPLSRTGCAARSTGTSTTATSPSAPPSDALKVAYDVGPLLDPPTGVGRYARELSDALLAANADLVHYAVSWRGDERRVRSDVPLKRWRFPARWARGVWRRFDQPSIDKLTGAVDVVHATNFVLPPPATAAGVVTIHDLSFLRDDVFPGGEKLRDLVPWSIERADRVLVPARAIADEVIERFGAPSEKVIVTPEGVAPVFFGATPLADAVLEAMGIPGPYAVALGTLEPRKNLARLLAAWDASRGDLEGWTLVLAGPRGWGPELPETPGVVLPGWVGDETLPGLLAGAGFFCYPSLYEGFGLPPLEAMAAGTPVLAGRHPVSEEVLGDAALLVDPLDVEAIAAGLRTLAARGPGTPGMLVAGRARAAGYTWEATARATLDAYAEALAARSSRRTTT